MAVGTPTSRSYRPAARSAVRPVPYGPAGTRPDPRRAPRIAPRPAVRTIPLSPPASIAKPVSKAAMKIASRWAPFRVILPLAYATFPGWNPQGQTPMRPGLLANQFVARAQYANNLLPHPATRFRTSSATATYTRTNQWETAYFRPQNPLLFPPGDVLPEQIFPPLNRPGWYQPLADPLAVPRQFPEEQPAPFALPRPAPRTRPRPGQRPRPAPRPNMRPIAFRITPNAATRTNPRGRPRKNEKERKSKATGAAAAFWAAFNFATELNDFAESVLIGFGIEPKGTKYNWNTLLDIVENPSGHSFNVADFATALIYNEVEDRIVGRASGALTKSLRNLGIRVYGSASPGQGMI